MVPQFTEPLDVLVYRFSRELVDAVQVCERGFAGSREELGMETFLQLFPSGDGPRGQRGVPTEGWLSQRQREQPNFHMFGP